MKAPAPAPALRRLVLLGATGSIGASALRVVRAHPDRLRLVGVSSQRRTSELAEIAREFGVRHLAVGDPAAAPALARERLPDGAQVLAGPSGLAELASLTEADLVLVAVVGTAGLAPTLAAIAQGKDIALANKELLVLGGRFVLTAVARHGVRLLPVDSEHNAIFQCLESAGRTGLGRILLTASGGAFRDRPLADLASVTPAEARCHPNWSMGPKVTIDSATMANKGLELIEAHWLFGLPEDRIAVVLHPQSVVHSMVEFIDGSVVAQLSPPSMTFAIQHALLHPDRAPPVHAPLDFTQALTLDFRPPDPARYPCLGLARAALRAGASAPAVFNAANEVAVAAFESGRLGFLGIPQVIEHTLDRLGAPPDTDLEAVLAADAEARRIAAART